MSHARISRLVRRRPRPGSCLAKETGNQDGRHAISSNGIDGLEKRAQHRPIDSRRRKLKCMCSPALVTIQPLAFKASNQIADAASAGTLRGMPGVILA